MRFICHWVKSLNPFKSKDTHLKLFAEQRLLMKRKSDMDPKRYERKLQRLDERYSALPKVQDDE